jgi:hypothetical protein
MDIGRRTLQAGDIASNAFQAWFANFTQVFIIALMFTVPIFIVDAAVQTSLPEVDDDLANLDLGDALFTSLVGGFVTVLLGTFLSAALVYAFIRIYRGEPVIPGESLSAVLDHIGPILVFAIITAIATAIGFILLIIPGILAIVVFSLGLPSILNERRGGGDAVSRCFALISGNWGVALGVVAIGFVVTIVGSLILGGISGPGTLTSPNFSDFRVFRTLIQIAASALLAPLIPSLATALYFELKGRNDGFPSIEETGPVVM